MTRRTVLALIAVFAVVFTAALTVDHLTYVPPVAGWDAPPPPADALARAEAEGYAAAAEGRVSMCNSPYPAMTADHKGELRQKWIKGYVAWMAEQYRQKHGTDAVVPTPILPGHLTDAHSPTFAADAPPIGTPDGTLPAGR